MKAPVLGCSLPTAFMANRPSLYGQAADWSAMYGSIDACLVALAERGVRSVELRDVRARTDLDDVERAIAKAREHGLSVTLHLWLPHESDALDGVISQAGRALGDVDAPIPCTLHAHCLTGGVTRAEALRTTAVALGKLCDALTQAASPLVPALELCRQRAGGPVGTTFDELVAVRRTVDAPHLGLCWDVGHGLANHRAGIVPLAPGEDFLGAVVHTHLHDLDVHGSTHGPLTHEGAATDLIRRLVRSGYRGCYHLELEPGRWSLDATARRRAVETSIAALARAVASTLAEGPPPSTLRA